VDWCIASAIPALTVAGWCIATVLQARPACAGSVLVDLTDSQTIEAHDADAPLAPERALALLLVEVVRERVAAGALGLTTAVPVVVPGDDGPDAPLARQERLPVGELLQLLLLADSRAAARGLAAAAGPGEDRTRALMRRAAARLDLRSTTVPDDWPHSPGPPSSAARGLPAGGARGTFATKAGRTTLRDLARLATAVARDRGVRRRLALDGVPIADGRVIVRATAPLVAVSRPQAPRPGSETSRRDGRAETPTAIVLGSRDNLVMLAVATGAAAEREAWDEVERGLARYERVQVVRAGQRIGRYVQVRGGSAPSFGAVAAEAFAVTARRGGRTSVGLMLQLPAVVEAPVGANQPVGELLVELGGHIVGAIPLVAPDPIGRSRWLGSTRR
jgi:D-alanyl-D-alanine carboxypeptidase